MTKWSERWAHSHRGRVALLVALVTAMTGPILGFLVQSLAGENLCSGGVDSPSPLPATLCFAPEVFVVSLLVSAIVLRRGAGGANNPAADVWSRAFGFSYLAFLLIVVGLIAAPPAALMSLCALWRFV